MSVHTSEIPSLPALPDNGPSSQEEPLYWDDDAFWQSDTGEEPVVPEPDGSADSAEANASAEPEARAESVNGNQSPPETDASHAQDTDPDEWPEIPYPSFSGETDSLREDTGPLSEQSVPDWDSLDTGPVAKPSEETVAQAPAASEGAAEPPEAAEAEAQDSSAAPAAESSETPQIDTDAPIEIVQRDDEAFRPSPGAEAYDPPAGPEVVDSGPSRQIKVVDIAKGGLKNHLLRRKEATTEPADAAGQLEKEVAALQEARLSLRSGHYERAVAERGILVRSMVISRLDAAGGDVRRVMDDLRTDSDPTGKSGAELENARLASAELKMLEQVVSGSKNSEERVRGMMETAREVETGEDASEVIRRVKAWDNRRQYVIYKDRVLRGMVPPDEDAYFLPPELGGKPRPVIPAPPPLPAPTPTPAPAKGPVPAPAMPFSAQELQNLPGRELANEHELSLLTMDESRRAAYDRNIGPGSYEADVRAVKENLAWRAKEKATPYVPPTPVTPRPGTQIIPADAKIAYVGTNRQRPVPPRKAQVPPSRLAEQPLAPPVSVAAAGAHELGKRIGGAGRRVKRAARSLRRS